MSNVYLGDSLIFLCIKNAPFPNYQTILPQDYSQCGDVWIERVSAIRPQHIDAAGESYTGAENRSESCRQN